MPKRGHYVPVLLFKIGYVDTKLLGGELSG